MTIETSPFGCFRCNGADHWADACPELIPARTYKEHMARIDKYVEWCNGKLPLPGRITPRQKQRLIEHENESWRKATERKAG